MENVSITWQKEITNMFYENEFYTDLFSWNGDIVKEVNCLDICT